MQPLNMVPFAFWPQAGWLCVGQLGITYVLHAVQQAEWAHLVFFNDLLSLIWVMSSKALHFHRGCIPVQPSASANLHFLGGLPVASTLATATLASTTYRGLSWVDFFIPSMANFLTSCPASVVSGFYIQGVWAVNLQKASSMWPGSIVASFWPIASNSPEASGSLSLVKSTHFLVYEAG
jgi:hypothetical protein